jgi:RNA polymerase sigma-70 factor (ECF subfamily)
VPVATLAATPRSAAPSAPAPRSPAIERAPQPRERSSRIRSAPAARATGAKAATPELAPNVAGEIALLDEAQRALASGQPDRALQILDRHAREFPRGSLIEERSAARIIALCALGRLTTARAESAAFVRRFPSSPLVDRVRAACGANLAPAANPAEEN